MAGSPPSVFPPGGRPDGVLVDWSAGSRLGHEVWDVGGLRVSAGGFEFVAARIVRFIYESGGWRMSRRSATDPGWGLYSPDYAAGFIALNRGVWRMQALRDGDRMAFVGPVRLGNVVFPPEVMVDLAELADPDCEYVVADPATVSLAGIHTALSQICDYQERRGFVSPSSVFHAEYVDRIDTLVCEVSEALGLGRDQVLLLASLFAHNPWPADDLAESRRHLETVLAVCT